MSEAGNFGEASGFEYIAMKVEDVDDDGISQEGNKRRMTLTDDERSKPREYQNFTLVLMLSFVRCVIILLIRLFLVQTCN